MRTLTLPPPTLSLEVRDRWTRRRDGALVWRAWESRATACGVFREEFVAWALVNQRQRCAYCTLEMSVDRSRLHSVDHIAPKLKYPRWTYEAVNLVLACYSCNLTLKGEFDCVVLPEGESPDSVAYEDCRFLHFHPYLDDARTHFEGGWDGTIDNAPTPLVALNEKALATANFFQLLSPGRYLAWVAEHADMKRSGEDELLSQADRERKRAIQIEVNNRR